MKMTPRLSLSFASAAPLLILGCSAAPAPEQPGHTASVSLADECGNGYNRPGQIPIWPSSDDDGPKSVRAAEATFDQRAQSVIKWSACEDHAAEQEYNTNVGQDWLYNAIGRLSYEGSCDSDNGLDAKTASAKRQNDVDDKLSRIANFCPEAQLGSEINGSWNGIGVQRTGELDFDLNPLLPIAFL